MLKSNRILILLGILFLVCSSLFHRVMFDDYLFLTQDTISAKSVKHGIEASTKEFDEYPIWLPWMFSGLPSTHSMQNISEYYLPHHIISLIKAINVPWFWNYLLHFLFAGIGMYLLLSRLKLDFFSSLFGAISFMIMPWMVTMIVHGHGSQVMTASYIPWVMWSLIRLKEEPDIRSISILAFIIGLQLQRAHVQIAYYSWILMGMYLIYDMVLSYKSKYNIDLKFLIRWLVASALGFCMSLWIYIPLLNYAPYSKRSVSEGGAAFDYATSWSLHPYEMLSMILPSSFGFGELSYFGYMPMTNFPNYIGIIIFLLAILAFYQNSSKIKYLLLSILILSLLVSFGKYTFFYALLYDWLPYFNKFRVPSMILVLFQFSISILAAIGLNNLIEKLKKKDKAILKIICCISGAILFLALYRYFFVDFSLGWDQRLTTNNFRNEMIRNDLIFVSIFLSSIIIATYCYIKDKIRIEVALSVYILASFFDLYVVGYQIINPQKEITYTQDIPIKDITDINNQFKFENDDIIKFLKKDKSKFRVFSASFEKQQLKPDHNNNRLAAFNIESIGGYHPAKLSIFESFDSVPLLNRFKILNVKYLILSNQINHPSLKLVASGSYYSNLNYRLAHIYEYLEFEPRVQFLENINSVDSREDGYKILNTDSFNISENSFISKSDFNNSPQLSFNPSSEIYIKGYSPNKIIITTDAKDTEKGQHFVLLSEIYFPHGWEISGAPSLEIIEVNNLLRGFFVPSGKNEIILEFKPKDLVYSSIITYFSLIIILIMFITSFIYNKNEKF